MERLARLFAAGAAATIMGGCSTTLSGREVTPAMPAAIGAPAKTATKHLYVIVTLKQRFIAEYPMRNGIPQSPPDRTVFGLRAPNAITLDGAGNLYVLDLKTIKEFAPGVSGHPRPTREIDVPSFLNIDTLAVDGSGYVYVGQAGHVYVYAPGAHGHATPVAKFKPVGYPAGFVLDPDDNFYSLGNTQRTVGSSLQFQMHTSVYAAAPGLQLLRKFCSEELPQSGIDYGIALDGRRRAFTTHTFFVGSYPQGEIDVYPAGADQCPMNPTVRITTMQPPLREPVYLAIDDSYLYVGDVFYGNGGDVFTLRTTGKVQTPLGVLDVAGNKPHDVFGIAVGP
ncbi:MAG: hypothetical protein JO113_03475 [Candidatus Eremiobacteraeota bacterium]|nr:hypothetical protein [Candidatus Eremiobacteraeota bacterium]